MSPGDLVAHPANHRVRTLRPKAAQVIAAVQEAVRAPQRQRATAARLLAEEVAVFNALLDQLAAYEVELARLLPHTPAKILTTIPGVGVVTASNYAPRSATPAISLMSTPPTATPDSPRRPTSGLLDGPAPFGSARSARSNSGRRSSGSASRSPYTSQTSPPQATPPPARQENHRGRAPRAVSPSRSSALSSPTTRRNGR